MPDHHVDVPPGYELIPARTTYLEMLRNEVPEPPLIPAGASVEVWQRPPVDEYRQLFRAVGGPWGWAERMLLSDAELAGLLAGPDEEIVRLLVGGQAAGLCELDRSVPGQAEIVYFGLRPEFIGRGLGGFFLRWCIHHAWTAGAGAAGPGPGGTESAGAPQPVGRLWLHTCEHDSPAALPLYQKAGFRTYDVKDQLEPYPDDFVRRLRAAAGSAPGSSE